MGVLKKLLSYDTVFTEELLQRIREQYIPTNWVSGEIITATRLNHMEQGIYENSKMAENTVQQDGEYPFLTAGLAENLESDTFTVNQTPYFIRQTINNSDREIDSVVGGSVGWNQQYNASIQRSETISGVTFTVNNDGSITADGTATADIRKSFYSPSFGRNENVGRKIFISGCPSGGSISSYMLNVLYIGESKPDTGNGNIWEIPDTQFTGTFGLKIMSGTVCNNIIFKPQITDLTTLLGDAIADYIYTIETANSGAGIAKLKSWGFFAEDYYEYDEGSIKSVEGFSAHITRDANENIIGNYPLDSSLVLRGIPKLNASNDLYYDGDVYSSDGTVTRKYGERQYESGDELLTDVITDGTTTVYKLETPTTETAESFQNPQIVTAGGTEEYVSTGIVPVGHYTQYPENLKAKLESLPSLPTQEGVYVLKYDDGVASYILLETDETVVDMLARIAALEGE